MRAVVAQIEGLGVQRLDTDTLAMVARAADIDLAGWSGSLAVPLDATMPAVLGFRRVLANLAEAIDANWQGTIDEIDTEFLHDLRVAVRRTRSVLSEGKQVLPPAVIDLAGKRLAWFGTLTGPPRDLDVYLIEWSEYTAGFDAAVIAALDPVHAVLAQRCRSAHADLVQFMRSAEAAEHMAAWRTWLSHPDARVDPGAAADDPLGTLISTRIRKAHARLVEHGRRIDPASPAEQVHDLRKDAKKLRYLLECFGSLLTQKPTKLFVSSLKVLQDNLGEYQDNEVHADELRSIAARLPHHGVPPETMMAIGQLVERFDQRRTAARAEFAERFAEFDSKVNRRTLKSALETVEP
jgi:CHAD domain-containing protein